MDNSIMVIGDVMVDKYTFGDIERLNPEEHGAPLLLATSEEYRLGGAANVAANLSNVGINTSLIGIIGNDPEGDIIKQLLEGQGIGFFPVEHKNHTIIKERFMYHGRQIARVDKEIYCQMTDEMVNTIIRHIKTIMPSLIIFSDYGKGIAHSKLLHELKNITNEHQIKILADVKPQNIDFFHDIYLIKPNFKEFCGMIGRTIDPTNIHEIETYGNQLAKMLGTNLIITKGAYGASLIMLDGTTAHIGATSSIVVDVTGAGDSFLAGVAVGITRGLTLEQSMQLGNQSSGAVVTKLGTSLVQKSDLE